MTAWAKPVAHRGQRVIEVAVEAREDDVVSGPYSQISYSAFSRAPASFDG